MPSLSEKYPASGVSQLFNQQQPRVPTLMIRKLALPNTSMFFLPFGMLDKYESMKTRAGDVKNSSNNLPQSQPTQLARLKKRPGRKRLLSFDRKLKIEDNESETPSKVLFVCLCAFV